MGGHGGAVATFGPAERDDSRICRLPLQAREYHHPYSETLVDKSAVYEDGLSWNRLLGSWNINVMVKVGVGGVSEAMDHGTAFLI